MNRALLTGMIIGWLAAVLLDFVIGYEYRAVVSETPTRDVATLVNQWGWEPQDPARPTYLRRRRIVGWSQAVPGVRAVERWVENFETPGRWTCIPKSLCS